MEREEAWDVPADKSAGHSLARKLLSQVCKGSPTERNVTSIWALPVWGGGGLDPYLEKNCPSSNGHLLDYGGVKMLARMVWGTYAVKIEVQMGICLC